MSEKIVLIDGHSILHRAFYGVPPLTNSKGMHTNAIYGFLNIFFKIIDSENPDYIAVAFDRHAPTFRHEIYKEYKGTRKPMPDEMRPQVPKIKEVLKAMNVLVVEQDGLEADDLIGTISRIGEKADFDVTIVSGDRDLLQLPTDKIKMLLPKTQRGRTDVETYYPQDVLEKYKVQPKGIIDLKALMGDSSDNIPGVPRVGEKTATNLLMKYESLDGVYEYIDEITPPSIKKTLEENEELARLSYTLATIKTDAKIDFKLQDAKREDFYTKEAFEQFCDLEFKKFLERFDNDIAKESVKENNINIIDVKINVEQYILSLEIENEIVGVDFKFSDETDNSKSVIQGVAITTNKGSAFFESNNSKAFEDKSAIKEIDGQYVLDIDNTNNLETCEISEKDAKDSSLNIIENVFKCLFEKKAKVSIFGLQQLLHKADIRDLVSKNLDYIFDIKLAYYEIDPLKSEYIVRDVCENYGNCKVEGIDDLNKLSLYYSYGIYNATKNIRKILNEKSLDKVYREIDLPLAISLSDMEKIGIRCDGQALETYSDKLFVTIEKLQKEIYEECGEEFNINSPKQLGIILFEKLNLPNGKKTKTGYSTAADVLEKLSLDYPIVNKILKYRTLSKLRSTYAQGLQNFISNDGRIHGKFHQTITATGRISSSEPNLQNIPIRMEEGRKIRQVFLPKEGYVFLDADYSQIELRILAHMSEDENLINDFKEGKDIHKSTASKAFNIPFEEVSENDRRKAKAINFGIVYGMSAFGLGEDLGISRKEAKEYIESYFLTYPKVKAFLDGQVKFAKDNGYVKTLFGRIRPIPEINNSNFMRRSFGERVAMNSPIQGSAADIMKIAMFNVGKRLIEEDLKSRIVVQVHDELLVETLRSEIEQVRKILEEEMRGAASLSVPLIVDIGEGTDWLAAH